MRRRLTLAAIAVVVLVGGGLFLVTRGDDGAESGPAENSGLVAQTQSVGEIDIKVQPRLLDDQGSTFEVTLDTHSAELDMDLSDATLEVADTEWRSTGWDGDGPGGHHREGEIRFEPAGPASGTARLVLVGFAEPVEFTWDLGD